MTSSDCPGISCPSGWGHPYTGRSVRLCGSCRGLRRVHRVLSYNGRGGSAVRSSLRKFYCHLHDQTQQGQVRLPIDIHRTIIMSSSEKPQHESAEASSPGAHGHCLAAKSATNQPWTSLLESATK